MYFSGSEAKHPSSTEYVYPSGTTVFYSYSSHAWVTLPYVTSGGGGGSSLLALPLTETTRLSAKLLLNSRGKTSKEFKY